MGELHLDIAVDRLRRQHGVPVRLGRVAVSYRETIGGAAEFEVREGGFPCCSTATPTRAHPLPLQLVYDRVLGGRRHWVRLAFAVEPLPLEEGEPQGGGGDGSVPPEPCIPQHNDFEAGEGGEDGGPLRCRVLSESGGAGASRPDDDDDDDGEGSGPILKPMPPALADALRDAVGLGLDRGPLLGYAVVGVRVRGEGGVPPSAPTHSRCRPPARLLLQVRVLEERCAVSPDSTAAAVRACTARALSDALLAAGALLLEPSMRVEVVAPDRGSVVGDVLSDLTTTRRGRVREVAPLHLLQAAGGGGGGGPARVAVRADVPLREMVGYSTALRSRTSGEGSFAMEFARYEPVGAQLQAALCKDPALA